MSADPMVKCHGCGFNVEREDVTKPSETLNAEYDARNCVRCRKCTENPDMRESYRRGYNAGLDAASAALRHAVERSNLRKHGSYDDDDG